MKIITAAVKSVFTAVFLCSFIKFFKMLTCDGATLVFLLVVFVLESHSVTSPPDSFHSVSEFSVWSVCFNPQIKLEQRDQQHHNNRRSHCSRRQQSPSSICQQHANIKHHNHQGPAHRHITQVFPFHLTVFIRMDGRTLLLLCVAVFICAGETEPEKSEQSFFSLRHNRVRLFR